MMRLGPEEKHCKGISEKSLGYKTRKNNVYKIIITLLTAFLIGSPKVYAAGERIQNGFVGLEYTVDKDWKIGYSHVDTGYGFFDYINKHTIEETVAIIANDLAVTESVSLSELDLIRRGAVDRNHIADWLGVEAQQVTKERIDGREYFVFELTIDGEDWVYFITYNGTVEYQFCMLAGTKAQAEPLRDFLKNVTYIKMDLIIKEDIGISFEDIGAMITVPYNSVYYHRGMDKNHPNWMRIYETYSGLNQWFRERSTYAYLVSDDIYYEILFYTIDSVDAIDFRQAPESLIREVGEGLKKGIEETGSSAVWLDGGIYKGKNVDFVSLLIQDIKGYDSMYYYTSDGVTGFVLECYYHEDDRDEDFLQMYSGILGSFTIQGGNGGDFLGGGENTGGNGYSGNLGQPGEGGTAQAGKGQGGNGQAGNGGSFVGGMPFSDIGGHWAAQSILLAYEKGLVSGVGDGKFNPDATVTRAEFIQMIGNILGLQGGRGTEFRDVPAGAWYFSGIAGAEQAGILKGFITAENNLQPNRPITREEMALILGNVAALKGFSGQDNPDLNIQFQDYSLIQKAYRDGVTRAVGAGLMTGMTQNQFAPKATSTRAQAAQVLINIMANS